MIKLIIVNGTAGAGKTTFEDFCSVYLGQIDTFKISTIDRIKEAAKVLGWDGTKTPENRKFLSDLKDLSTQWADVPFQTIKGYIHKAENELENLDVADIHTYYIFTDSREPEEIQRFKDELGGITVLVRNEKQEQVVASNHADANVLQFNYDYVINNNGTLEELKAKARIFCQLIKARKN